MVEPTGVEASIANIAPPSADTKDIIAAAMDIFLNE